MKRVDRPALSAAAAKLLAARQADVDGANDPKARATQLWNGRPAPLGEVREVLEHMASGRKRCMYCEDSAGTDIDHFRPKSDYPERSFTWTNYLLACSYCNSNAKRNEFPLAPDGSPLLVDPSVEEPSNHLVLSLASGKYIALDDKGRETIRVFRLSRGLLETGRLNRWRRLRSLLVEYDRLVTAGEESAADELGGAIRDESFAAVLTAAIRAADSPHGAEILGDACAVAIRNRAEIRHWA